MSVDPMVDGREGIGGGMVRAPSYGVVRVRGGLRLLRGTFVFVWLGSSVLPHVLAFQIQYLERYVNNWFNNIDHGQNVKTEYENIVLSDNN